MRQNLRTPFGTVSATTAVVLVVASCIFEGWTDAFVTPSHFVASPMAASRFAPTQHFHRLQASAALPVPNPFKKLPWNVEKERQREARRLKLERAKLHRELGIAEDAAYEEIVAATDSLIARAGGDLKRKIQIEVAKDKILQIRLNERLAGLASQSKEARAQSTYEVEGYVGRSLSPWFEEDEME